MTALKRCVCLFALCFAAPAWAQSATIAVFPSAVTNPNTGTPVRPAVAYTGTAVRCGQIRTTESPAPIVNPAEGWYADPVDATKDCFVDIATQVAAIPVGSGYKAAIKIGTGTFGALSTAFAVQATHPCDGTAPTSGTVLEGTRTLTWCWDGLDTNGSATTPTGWAFYTDGVRSLVTGVTVGATANAAGQKLYAVSVPITRGTHSLQMSAVNAQGEAASKPVFAATVTVAAAAPTPSTIRGIQ